MVQTGMIDATPTTLRWQLWWRHRRQAASKCRQRWPRRRQQLPGWRRAAKQRRRRGAKSSPAMEASIVSTAATVAAAATGATTPTAKVVSLPAQHASGAVSCGRRLGRCRHQPGPPWALMMKPNGLRRQPPAFTPEQRAPPPRPRGVQPSQKRQRRRQRHSHSDHFRLPKHGLHVAPDQAKGGKVCSSHHCCRNREASRASTRGGRRRGRGESARGSRINKEGGR